MYPILFEIPLFGWPIYSYGVMLGLSIILGWYLTLGLGERDGLSRQMMGSCYFWCIAAALFGARLLYLITNPDEFDQLGDFFRFREGGLVAYGGFLGGLGGSAIYCRIRRVRLWAWADATAIPIALGLSITRIGCFLYGCCYGRRTTEADPAWLRSLTLRFPNWDVRFPGLEAHELHGAPSFLHHVNDLSLEANALASYPILPTQLIEVLNGFVAVALLLLIRRYRRFRGQVFLTFAIYYGVARFIVEIMRDDTQRGTIGPAIFGWFGGFQGRITTSQFIGVVTILLASATMIWFARQARKDPEAAMALGEGALVEVAGDGKSKELRSKRSQGRRKKKS